MLKKTHTVNDSRCDIVSLESYRIVLDTYQLGDATNTLHVSAKSTYLNALCRKDAFNVVSLIFPKETVNKVIDSDQCVWTCRNYVMRHPTAILYSRNALLTHHWFESTFLSHTVKGPFCGIFHSPYLYCPFFIIVLHVPSGHPCIHGFSVHECLWGWDTMCCLTEERRQVVVEKEEWSFCAGLDMLGGKLHSAFSVQLDSSLVKE